VSLGVELLGDEVVGKPAGLVDTIDAFPDFEVCPAILGELVEAVFDNELLWGVVQLDADIFVFVAVEGSIKVKLCNVKYCKFGTATKQDTVEEDLDELEGLCRHVDVTRETNAVASNGDGSLVGVFFVGFNFAHHTGVCDFLAAVGEAFAIMDGEEGVGACGAFA